MDALPDFYQVAAQCAPLVARETLDDLTTVESRRNPYAIGINGKRLKLTHQPRRASHAVELARQLIAAGESVDLGWAQINSRNLPKLALSIEQAFDPCTNLQAAQTVLRDWCFLPTAKGVPDSDTVGLQLALQRALSCYNTGDYSRGMRNGYVNAIYQAARQRVADRTAR